MLKYCGKCKETKDLSEFNNDKSKKDGLGSNCRRCKKGYNAKWASENPEKKKSIHDEWYVNNKEKVKIYSVKYYKEHPEVNLKSSKKQLTKSGKPFNMNYRKYKYALQDWSKTVRKRDNNECQICGSKEDLNAHHIMPKKEFPELSLNENNGITLCKKCHYEVHGRMLFSDI